MAAIIEPLLLCSSSSLPGLAICPSAGKLAWGDGLWAEKGSNGACWEELGRQLCVGGGSSDSLTFTGSYPFFLKPPCPFSLFGHMPPKWLAYIRKINRQL